MGFEPGQRWFIFGSHGPAGPRTSFCQHSHRLSPTDRLPDLPARGGVVNGWFGRPGAPGGLVDGPSDVPVWIDTPLGRIATRTTDGGSFSLAGVPPGVWTVAFAVGPDLRARAVIELEPTDDCFGVRAWARFAGGLSGTVVDEAGVPVVGAPITAILTTDPDGIYQFHGETGDTGQFLIDALDPGPYVVRVGKEGEENGQVPYRPLFYPAAQERAEAKAIDVGARVVRLDPIVMRAPLPTVTLAVDIVCRDGTRPPRAYVTADRMDGEGIRNYASPQGTGGHHTVRVLARYRYRVGGTVFVTRKGRDGSPAPSLVETSALEVDTAAQPSLVRLRADLDGCDAPGGPWIGVR
jgi:hypothetical protein